MISFQNISRSRYIVLLIFKKDTILKQLKRLRPLKNSTKVLRSKCVDYAKFRSKRLVTHIHPPPYTHKRTFCVVIILLSRRIPLAHPGIAGMTKNNLILLASRSSGQTVISRRPCISFGPKALSSTQEQRTSIRCKE